MGDAPARFVAVFGAATVLADDPVYAQARRLGSLLARAGFGVMTGGYGGVMEAASRGAAEAGGFAVGVTCDEIERWRPVGPNRYVHAEHRVPRLSQRLTALVSESSAAVVLPGGFGTLAEVFVLGAHLQAGALTPRPLVLVGPAWRAAWDGLVASLGPWIRPRERGLVTLADDVDEAAGLVVAALGEGPPGEP